MTIPTNKIAIRPLLFHLQNAVNTKAKIKSSLSSGCSKKMGAIKALCGCWVTDKYRSPSTLLRTGFFMSIWL
jgi:hypothetical protein